jgi:hypothetical protein
MVPGRVARLVVEGEDGDDRVGRCVGPYRRLGHGNRDVRLRLDVGDEHVALTVDRPDHLLCATGVPDGPADRLDLRRECRFAHEAIAPDVVEQLRLGDDAVAVLDEVDEDRHGARLERHQLTATPDLPPGDVEHAVREPHPHRFEPTRVRRGEVTAVRRALRLRVHRRGRARLQLLTGRPACRQLRARVVPRAQPGQPVVSPGVATEIEWPVRNEAFPPGRAR